MKKLLISLAVLLGLTTSAYAQQTVATTTLAANLTGTQTNVSLTSDTGVVVGTSLFFDRELVSVVAVNPSGTFRVSRGLGGTVAAPHQTGVIVYEGPSTAIVGQGPFWQSDPPFGSCTPSAQQYSVRINVFTGVVWQCTNNTWLNIVDAYEFVPASACQSSVSGNASGTNGLTTIGTAPSLPVIQASTSVTGTNTHYFMCTIPPPSRLHISKAVYIVDIQFYYGVQTTALGTQVAVLASGTMNGATVFTTIPYPVAAASETATGLTQVARADSGTLTITPVVGSFNVATTTAGQFYSAAFIPAVPIPMATDRQSLQFTISLLNTATSATVTNSPGFIVHYRMLDAGF